MVPFILIPIYGQFRKLFGKNACFEGIFLVLHALGDQFLQQGAVDRINFHQALIGKTRVRPDPYISDSFRFVDSDKGIFRIKTVSTVQRRDIGTLLDMKIQQIIKRQIEYGIAVTKQHILAGRSPDKGKNRRQGLDFPAVMIPFHFLAGHQRRQNVQAVSFPV
ncbi:hypothetical protein SDC9_176477 [bioreactor metagenome]|uniref:Uncharacterized protein n=1 Tax=bioreactor metagenome TaxID=1076179 RepID=A0A645GT96_9ZZZZ